MSPYLRQVKTVSGATAVQVVAKDHGVRRIVEHLGSAHDEAELAALMRLGRQRLLAGQQVLDLGPALNDDADEVGGQAPGDGGAVRRPQIISRRSGWPIEAIRSAYRRLGLGEAVGGDQAFEQMVAARLIEPTSKADTPRVLSEIGWPAPAHRNTLYASLGRCVERGYRQAISQALFEHVTASGGLALCLYDVTPSTSRPSVRTTCGGSATPKSGGSIPRSSSGCWSTGPVFLSRSAAGRATRPRSLFNGLCKPLWKD